MRKPGGFPFNAIVLMQNTSPGASPRDRGLGTWIPCEVLKREGKAQQYMVVANGGDVLSCLRLQLCLLDESLVKHAARIEQALLRRAVAVNLMRYYFMVDSIPYDSCIVSTMETEQVERISRKAKNMSRLLGDNLFPTLEATVADCKELYEGIMKKIIFGTPWITFVEKLFIDFNELCCLQI